MPVRLLITLLAVASVGLLAAGILLESSALGLAAVPFVLGFVMSFVFRPQLEYAYLRRRPSDLDPPVVKLLETQSPPWYGELDEAGRAALRSRTVLVQRAFAFRGQGFPDGEVPDDVQALIATQAARALGDGECLTLEPVETVVVYKHAFPSPQYPDHWHHSELFAEDGVILLDLERAVPGIMSQRTYFNVALYECLRAARLAGVAPGAQGQAEDWREAVRRVVGAEPNWVAGNIGLPEEHVDGWAVAEVLRLDFPEE